MRKKAACIAVLGTGSDVGKSIVTTALCRVFANKGVKVAPYKAQNMSNNSGVTAEGMEMGRAQIVQAEAARVPPHVDMNPVLLKPTSDVGSQVVLNGKAWINASSTAYYEKKEYLFQQSCEALERLRQQYDVIVMEGAGSCAEVNLMASDIVNLNMAAYANAPVILVADIDRGGVFAQIVGSLACISREQQALIHGFVINRFRGDISLFKSGVDWIEERTGKPVYGVLPWYKHFHIEAEDSVVIENAPAYLPDVHGNGPVIGVIKLPHISNFTDFDPLMHLDGVHLVYLQRPQDISRFKAIILPGSKSTCSDLKWLEETGWKSKIMDYVAGSGHVLGVCGGYQMLGTKVHDPDGIEGAPDSIAGLSLLDAETVLKSPKTTTLTEFSWEGRHGCGYEIHMGQTEIAGSRGVFKITTRNQVDCDDEDGCIGNDGKVMGTYMHGLFDTPEIAEKWLDHIGLANIKVERLHGPAARDRAYDQLADHALAHLDIDKIQRLIDHGTEEKA